ncbi:Gfo/Idh/MocA family protein [Runella aurantiaca]|uniref:Gfo/Idh/MocA family oxidoreductase n=1 Tax=Runella aurantiaca TaxID=2282308 RepID=A0A369IDL3_9BACT|nr:Gfo/Idh/MocA family oxidoreductase [Runella aurantiaca]RDB07132.1 gfo/Idh/MocA family oxidoreductase [Runella aurantiaca]
MSLSTQLPLLVIGAGSIGERHIEILQSLGYQNINVYRQRMLPLRNIPTDSVYCFTEFNEIEVIKPYAAIICTPTAQHLAQALECVKRRIHVLVEKPLANHPEGIQELKKEAAQTNSLVQVAYMLRYHPLMRQLKSIIDDKRFGNLLSFSTYWGEYLPNWHPWEDYRGSYAAKRELGGGVALTLSHDLDIVSWLVGELPLRWQRSYNYRSNLEVNVESGASFLLEYPSGITGAVQLNYYQKVPKRTYELVFDDAFVTFDYFQNKIIIQTPYGIETIEEPDFERNEMFRQQTIDFLKNTTLSSTTSLTEQYLRESDAILNMCN